PLRSPRRWARGNGRSWIFVGWVVIMTKPTSTPESSASAWAPADRPEVIQRPEASRATVLMPGVELLPLVGAFNGARSLFTGRLTMAPGVSYPFYARPFTEAVVLLEGEAAVDVEGRRYRLGPLDAISVEARRPRRLVNRSAERRAVLHLALAST